jgi:CheY-like chemotaxis protein
MDTSVAKDFRPGEIQLPKARILLVDDNVDALHSMVGVLQSLNEEVLTAASANEALKHLLRCDPAVILLDVMMPGMDGWAVLSTLKSEPEVKEIPVVMLTIVDDKNLGYTLGASDYMIKPVDRNRLTEILSKFRNVPSPRSALVVDDEEFARKVLTQVLEKEGWNVIQAENGLMALERIAQQRPDLILLDLMMPKMNGYQFVTELHKHEEWRSIPVIVVTARDMSSEERIALDGFVEKVLPKQALTEEALLTEIQDLIAACVRAKQPAQKKQVV